jgi:CHAT domain-containing protein
LKASKGLNGDPTREIARPPGRAAVAALWGINDKSTQDLMEPIMESICKQDVDKVEALREAQQQSIRFLRLYRDHTHPFYWPAFAISGA